MRLVFISDTHNQHGSMKAIPDGDVLVHCGDFSYRGEPKDCISFNKWFAAQPHKYKILVPGNHDLLFETDEHQAREYFDDSIHVLIDQYVGFGGVSFYGSPVTPKFYDWAFMKERNGRDMQRHWDSILFDTDVLITHGPPYGVLDVNSDRPPTNCGCEMLLARVKVVRPKVHAFGHIHESAGVYKHRWDIDETTTFVNASTCTAGYKPKNAPIVVDI